MSEYFVDRYRSSLKDIDNEIRLKVNRQGGLTESKLLDLILNPQDYDKLMPRHPSKEDVQTGYDYDRCFYFGINAINSGSVATVIMAGGFGTRVGTPKALLEMPGLGMSLLTLKISKTPGSGPIWVVVSPTLKDEIINHVRSQQMLDQKRINFIEQYESYRLTPDNQISILDGKPELYPCGHGDLFQALSNSCLVEDFLKSAGRYIFTTNVDNVLGVLDPVTIGRHIDLNANVSCEVIERSQNDSGGVLCVAENGCLQIVEDFRICGVDPKSFKWLNTNSFIFNAGLNIAPLGDTWFRVQKLVKSRVVIQYERLLQEITDAYDTKYLAVERKERFMPIKNENDLLTASKLFY